MHFIQPYRLFSLHILFTFQNSHNFLIPPVPLTPNPKISIISLYIQPILLFFLIEQTLPMQKQINQISLNIALNLLNDYICEKSSEVMVIHQQFAREFQSKAQVDLHQWLIMEIRKINFQVKNIMDGTKEYFQEIQFGFVFQFFEKCCSIMQQNCKYLTQGLSQRINKKIDYVRPPYMPKQLAPSVVLGTDQQQVQPKDEKIKRYSRQINKDLESLDYFLNLLSYEDSKTYEEYKSQCDKILLQREMVENIRPSQASKEIMETANMIQNVMESSDKVFQDSYMIKYMEFKSFLNDLQNPDEINGLFKEEMEKQTKVKFKEGMNRTLLKCYEINKRQALKNMISFATQTQETKGKYQQKLQNLLIIQKKNNEKLSAQIRLLRKNKSNLSDPVQLQKIIQKQDQKQKQMESKYKILEALYNKKCQELQNPNEAYASQRESQLRKRVSISIQTQNRKVSVPAQTDLDFYYYFESKKIYDYKVKIIELQEIIKHKEYIIQEMQAIRTFRDNFKSKKEVYSTAIRSGRKMDKAKSLHYLDEDDQICDLRNQERKLLSSIDGTSKKKVTLNDFQDQNENQKKKLSLSKKNKKKTDLFKNKPYFALNQNVQDQQEQQPQKSQCQLQKVSLKSILKLGNNQFKKDFGMQTDQSVDYILPLEIGKSKIERAKLNSREKSDRDRLTKSKLRSSDVSSSFKENRQKSSHLEQRPSFRKSNFVALKELNDKKQDKPMSSTFNSPTLRLSGFPSPKKIFPEKQKLLSMTRTSKWNETKANTVGNEVLHVNNSLNFNFLVPINTTLKQTLSNVSINKNKSKHEAIKKMKLTSKIL